MPNSTVDLVLLNRDSVDEAIKFLEIVFEPNTPGGRIAQKLKSEFGFKVHNAVTERLAKLDNEDNRAEIYELNILLDKFKNSTRNFTALKVFMEIVPEGEYDKDHRSWHRKVYDYTNTIIRG